MELQVTTNPGLNISAEAQVLSYTYTGTTPLEVLARIDIGSLAHPIVGFGTYVVNFYINGILITPQTLDQVPAGKNQTIVVSRPVPLATGDTVTLKVLGLPADTVVDVTARLRTSTPLQLSDVYGSGPTAVNHNYGGTNALAYQTSGGAGIVGATVLVYRTSDYNAGNLAPSFILGRTVTIAGGAWQAPVFLTPGQYTVTFFLPGQFGVDTATITV